jgi:hypothetical protein
MLAFLDFEASSLAKTSYPIEIAWVFENGAAESHLIRPADGWTDWDPKAEAIHHIPRATLLRDGRPHDEVAQRMVAVLTGHDLLASAPSWDGKWLSYLLRAAGLPRHSLRLRDTEEAQVEAARAILAPAVPAAQLASAIEEVLTLAAVRNRGTPAHRAEADVEEERQRWLAVSRAAQAWLG